MSNTEDSVVNSDIHRIIQEIHNKLQQECRSYSSMLPNLFSNDRKNKGVRVCEEYFEEPNILKFAKDLNRLGLHALVQRLQGYIQDPEVQKEVNYASRQTFLDGSTYYRY